MSFGISAAIVIVNIVQMYALTKDKRVVNILKKVILMDEYIDHKRCSNCEYSCNWDEYKVYGFSLQCVRYPKWMEINNPYLHGCGEWKMRSEKKEGAENEQT